MWRWHARLRGSLLAHCSGSRWAAGRAQLSSSPSAQVQQAEAPARHSSGELTPSRIVEILDDYIIGQDAAKRAVAVALRNRWRRNTLDPAMAQEVVPKNILMIGPTGCGKTEIARRWAARAARRRHGWVGDPLGSGGHSGRQGQARAAGCMQVVPLSIQPLLRAPPCRLAKLTDSPFIKVEATKYTELGYVGGARRARLQRAHAGSCGAGSRAHAARCSPPLRPLPLARARAPSPPASPLHQHTRPPPACPSPPRPPAHPPPSRERRWAAMWRTSSRTWQRRASRWRGSACARSWPPRRRGAPRSGCCARCWARTAARPSCR
jgi:hypothetical protein